MQSVYRLYRWCSSPPPRRINAAPYLLAAGYGGW
ncbi:hypothetical protein YPPY19_2228, partial [Yersinia pestis PY-19]